MFNFLFFNGFIIKAEFLKWDLVFDGFVIFIHYKMINLDSITNKDNKEHNEKWPYTTDHPNRIIIIWGSGSGKTNALMNLINEQNNIDKITSK